MRGTIAILGVPALKFGERNSHWEVDSFFSEEGEK